MRYFELKEFDSPDLPGSGSNMNQEMLIALDNARDITKIPFNINSGFRTKNHNIIVGGKADSSHLLGFASDIKCINNTDRFKIINGLILAGFKRIGIAKTFIHADTDPNKPNCIWLY